MIILLLPIIAAIVGVFANSFSTSSLNIGVVNGTSATIQRLNNIIESKSR